MAAHLSESLFFASQHPRVSVEVPAGTIVPVRLTKALDSRTATEGASFQGTVTTDVVVKGTELAFPAGKPVTGKVVGVHAGKLEDGTSKLSVSIDSITSTDATVKVQTEPYMVDGLNVAMIPAKTVVKFRLTQPTKFYARVGASVVQRTPAPPQ